MEQPGELDGSVSPPGNNMPADGYSLHNLTQEPCVACSKVHARGFCPLKLAGVEHCALCGLAHFGSGHQRICPHLSSVTQCRVLLETIKQSNEPHELKDRAKRYIVGIIGDLNQRKKKEAAQALQVQQQQQDQALQPYDQTSASKRENGYSTTHQQMNSASPGKENKGGAVGSTSLAASSNPRRQAGVEEVVMGEGWGISQRKSWALKGVVG